MNQKRLSPSKKITLGAMVTALTMLCLYAVSVLPAGRLVCYFLASMFIYALCCEEAYGSAAISFCASVALAWLLLPDKLAAVTYTLLLGHYNIFRTLLNTRMQSRTFRALLKLLYCNVFTGIGLYLAVGVMQIDVMAALPGWLPAWGVVVAAQIAFVMLDVLQSLCEKIYLSHMRSAILPRR